jgi:Flp pilus assembly protein TadD
MRSVVVALLVGIACLGCATVEAARLYHSGTQALERGDLPRAIADLEGAAARVPHDAELHNRLGVAYAAAGRRDEALREFQSAVALDCDHPLAARNLRRAQREAGEVR